MSESKRNKSSNFESKEEAFEFLVQQSQNEVLKEQWRKELDQLPDAPLIEKKAARQVLIKRVLGIAASLILIAGSFFWISQNDTSLAQMANNMLEETNFVLESDSYTRGVDIENRDEIDIALQNEINIALEKNDFTASIGLFLTKEKKSQLTLEDKFYYSLSMAKVENGDYHKAIRLLNDVTGNEGEYYYEALWLKALLHLKVNESNQSKIILNKLINKSNYQINNTKALLEKMAD